MCLCEFTGEYCGYDCWAQWRVLVYQRGGSYPVPPHGYTEVLNDWVLNACLAVRWFLVPIFLFFPIVWLVWGTRATDRPQETTSCRKSRSFIFGCRFNVITTITLHTLQSLRVSFKCKIINTGVEKNEIFSNFLIFVQILMPCSPILADQNLPLGPEIIWLQYSPINSHLLTPTF